MKITSRRRGAPYSRPLEQMYSITEASQEVGVARQTMSRWIKTGRVSPVHRFSRTCVRVPVSSVNRYLKRTGRSPAIPPPTKGQPTGFRRPTEKNRLHAAAKRPGYLAFADRESITIYMKSKNKKSQPDASAPGNPSIQTATADECFAWTFASMAGSQALEAINRGEQPELSMLVLSEDGHATLSQLKPSLKNSAALFDVLERQRTKVDSERLALGFAVSGVGHLLAGVEEAFVVCFWGKESSGVWARSIERDFQDHAVLEIKHIFVEDLFRLLSHAFGFVEPAPDTQKRQNNGHRQKRSPLND